MAWIGDEASAKSIATAKRRAIFERAKEKRQAGGAHLEPRDFKRESPQVSVLRAPLSFPRAAALAAWLALALGTSFAEARDCRAEARFATGDTVIDVMSGRQGIVLRTHWNLFRREWMYQVRMKSPPARSCRRSSMYGPYCRFDQDTGTVWFFEVELRIVGLYPFSDDA